MPTRSNQAADLIRLFLGIRPFLRRIIVASVLLASVITVFELAGVRHTYQSQAIALVRPQVPVPRQSDSGEPVETKQIIEPLDVTDYVLLVKADSILAEVVQEYNRTLSPKGTDESVGIEGLRRQLTATERLEIKTPYEVEYYPTITLSAAATAPLEAYRLLSVWVDVIASRTHDVTFSAKEEALAYLEREYEGEKSNLIAIEAGYNAAKSEGEKLLDVLQIERAALEETYAVETIELLRKTREDWDTRIAAKAAEFNIPGLEARILADTMKLEGMKGAVAKKELEYISARNRVEQLGLELARLQSGGASSAIAAESTFTMKLPVPDSLFESTRQTVLEERGALEDAMRTPVTEPDDESPNSTDATEEEKSDETSSDDIDESSEPEPRGLRKRDAAIAEQLRDSTSPTDVTDAKPPEEPQRVSTSITRTAPDLSPEQKAYLDSVTISSVGADPGILMLYLQFAEAKIAVNSAPQEVMDMRQRVRSMQAELDSVQAKVFEKKSTLKNMDTSKESELEKITIERGYSQKNLERASEYALSALSRERAAIEEQLNRDFLAQEEMYTGIARGRLDAKLAVANTIEEIKIIAEPTIPEQRERPSIPLTFLTAFLGAAAVLTGACLAYVFVREIVANISLSAVRGAA